jgi:hypothetical protein
MTDVTVTHAQTVAQAHGQAMTDVATTVAQTATYGGAGAAIMSSHLSLPDWAAIVSMTVAILGFCLQLWLAWRATRHDFIKVESVEVTETSTARDGVSELDTADRQTPAA